jgi:hypothetical protein
VRTLVGLIASCGLIDPRDIATAKAFDQKVKQAYKAYRQCYRTELSKLFRGAATRDAGREFRDRFARKEEVRIRFLGVWDTVDAVGLPFHISDAINSTLVRFKFPDPYLSDCVDKACHALSIDDERHSFHPLVWNHKVNGERLEQVWFAGVHSNVGGGYEKHGLSLIALDWMMAHAEQDGLRFNALDRQFVRDHASVDDKLYDPRAGLGTFYRWKPRDIAEICAASLAPTRVHISVLERITHGVDHYAPANLPADIKVVTTVPAAGQDPTLINQRAANVEAVCNRIHKNSGALLDALRGTIFLGRFSYYLFLTACTAALLGLAVFDGADRDFSRALRNTGSLAGGLLSDPIETAFSAVGTIRANPVPFLFIFVALLLSSILSRISDGRISDAATGFWYQHQQELREALKNARKSLGG